MSAREDVTDWRELREFRGVDLSESFVLGWTVEGDTILVDLDLLLEPGHAFYEAPRPAEKVCIRPAVLEFPHCDAVQVDDRAASTALESVVASLAGGSIEGFCVFNDGVYEMKGSFGCVVVDAERPVLRLTGR